MKEPEQYILDGWDDICATASASLDSDCPLLEDEVLVEMHKYAGWLHREQAKQIQELNEIKATAVEEAVTETIQHDIGDYCDPLDLLNYAKQLREGDSE